MKTSKRIISAMLAGLMVAGTFSMASISVGAAETTNKIEVSSNLADSKTVTYNSNADQVTVTYMLQSDYSIINQQSVLTYDSKVLKLASTNTKASCLPVLGTGSTIFNSNLSNTIKFNSSDISDFFNFKTSKTFFTATFDVVGSGDTKVDLNVKILTGTKATDSSEVTTANDVALVDYDLSTGATITKPGFTFSQSAKVTEKADDDNGVKYSTHQLRGNITLALQESSFSPKVLTGTVDLPAGTYNFVVDDTATGTSYGRGSTHTDTITKAQLGKGWGYIKLVTTGGRYTFTFNTVNKYLDVACNSSIKNNLSTYKVRGSINVGLAKTSNADILKNTVALPAGDYRFVVTDDKTGISYGRNKKYSNSIGRELCGNNWGYVEFTVEKTGVYEFIYNKGTNYVTVLPVSSNDSDYAVFGTGIGFNFEKTSLANAVSKTVNLKAGTYTFAVTGNDGASFIGRKNTYTDAMANTACGKGWGFITFNVTKTGNYKFIFNTKNNYLQIAAV
jgi:hypothetical protein